MSLPLFRRLIISLVILVAAWAAAYNGLPAEGTSATQSAIVSER